MLYNKKADRVLSSIIYKKTRTREHAVANMENNYKWFHDYSQSGDWGSPKTPKIVVQ